MDKKTTHFEGDFGYRALAQRMARWDFRGLLSNAVRRKTLSSTTSGHQINDEDKPLGLLDLTGLGVGGTLGAGIFLLAGRAARDVAGPAVTVSFVLAAFVCFFSGLAYAEMSSRSPSCGGAYSFAYLALGELPAFLVGMCLSLEYGLSSAAVARSWASYLSEGFHFPKWLHSEDLSLLGFLLIVVITALLVIGIKEASWILNTATLAYGSIVIAIVAVGSFDVDPQNWKPFFPFGFEGVAAGAAAVFFSYVGFDEVAVVAEEARNAATTVPIAIVLSLTIVTTLYAASTIILTGLVKYSEISFGAPFAAAFDAVNRPVFAKVVGIGTALGMQNTALVSAMAQPRIFVAMSRDGLIPPAFAERTDRGTPRTSTIVCGTVVSLLALTIPTQRLADVVSGGTLLAFMATCAGLLVTRARLHNGRQDAVQQPYTYVSSLVAGSLVFGILLRVYTNGYLPLLPVLLTGGTCVSIPFLFLVSKLRFAAGADYEPKPPSFLCPLVPVIPALGCISTALLVTQLSHAALGALVIWLTISTFVYFLYGMRNSKADSTPLTDMELESDTSESYGSLPNDFESGERYRLVEESSQDELEEETLVTIKTST